jgi:hypothetical protein
LSQRVLLQQQEEADLEDAIHAGLGAERAADVDLLVDAEELLVEEVYESGDLGKRRWAILPRNGSETDRPKVVEHEVVVAYRVSWLLVEAVEEKLAGDDGNAHLGFDQRHRPLYETVTPFDPFLQNSRTLLPQSHRKSGTKNERISRPAYAPLSSDGRGKLNSDPKLV